MRKRFFILLGILLTGGSAQAVLFYSTGDPSYNTNAPAGALEGSGWQFQGRFNSFLGTPIGPHHFITAKHISGTSVGTKFYYNGQVYTTTAKLDDSFSDLTVWTVAERFSNYAPLYSNTDETGKGLVVFGRGWDRGIAVTNTTTYKEQGQLITTAMTNGWEWGSNTMIQRWGTNVVSTVTTVNGYPVMVANWDDGLGDNECMLAGGDSGGAVFIQEGGVWKLAGINYSIGPAVTYSFNADGSSSFQAVILKFTGSSPLYILNGTNWVTTSSLNITKSAFYASRISSRYSWITNSVTDFDRDADLLPDWWELTYTNSATAMSAAEDADGDGIYNLQEYIADTNPTNAASFFEMSGFLASTNQTIMFNGSTGRQYQIFYTTNDLAVTNLTWVAVHTNLVWGAGTNSSIAVTNTDDTVFYRLRVSLP